MSRRRHVGLRFESPPPRSSEERILPLVNVVFLLLLFFMVSGQIAPSDPIEATPPQSSSEDLPESALLQILVDAEGRLAVDGVVVEDSEFEQYVSERLGEIGPVSIHLKADGAAEAILIIDLMDRLREAGAGDLTLLTLPRVP